MVPSSPQWLAAPEDDLVVERLAQLRGRIVAAGRDPAEITVVAVTKGFAPGAVRAAMAAGIGAIGENYPSEMVAKSAALTEDSGDGTEASEHDGVCWHFLGAIQRRRVPMLAPLVACWQTVARLVEGEAIARRVAGGTCARRGGHDRVGGTKRVRGARGARAGGHLARRGAARHRAHDHRPGGTR